MDIRERVNNLLSEDCKDKLDGFDDFELQRIHEHTLMNDGCKIIDIYRNSRSHSVVELKMEKENGNKDAFCLIL